VSRLGRPSRRGRRGITNPAQIRGLPKELCQPDWWTSVQLWRKTLLAREREQGAHEFERRPAARRDGAPHMIKIAVIGATGRTGRLVAEQALKRGHRVVAYVRRAGALRASEGLRIVMGELFDSEQLQSALSDVDTVICCLGTYRHRPVDLMQNNLPQIVQAMKRAGRTRLILLSAYGVGETARTASLVAGILYKTMFRSIFNDKERSEAGLATSGLEWTGVYPVGLTDGPLIEAVEVRPTNEVKKVKGLPMVSRANVAKVLLDAAEDSRTIRQKLLVTSKGSLR
jgi:putative NADH-flavin reductase